jgi:hypothetical protein
LRQGDELGDAEKAELLQRCDRLADEAELRSLAVDLGHDGFAFAAART